MDRTVLEVNPVIKLETQLKYFMESNRRDTYKSWVFNDKAPCNAQSMAETGFIFVGTDAEPDAVKCFFCHKLLDCWDETDDPWQEHRKHSPNCEFAKADKPERCYTLQEFLEMRNVFIRGCLEQLRDKILGALDARFDEELKRLAHK